MSSVAVPAPFGGWNARDALDKMEPTDAVRMVNLIPRAGYVETRKGSTLHADGMGALFTLIGYNGSASERLLACDADQIFNATSDPPTSLGSGFTNGKWQHTVFDDRLILVNGADTPQVYNGTTITNMVATGPTLTTLWGACTFKGRAFYWAENAQSFWYAAAGAYQGTLTEFDLSTQLQTGGSLVMMVSWTLDAGDGVDDLAAFIFSSGEVLVYQGDDPGDANFWAMVGRFQIGEPLGPRAHAKVGGTEIIITRDGYVDLAAALKDGRYSETSTYSSKIIRAAKQVTALYFQQYGWEALLYPAGNLFIVNVPQTTTQSIQHVRETSSGGWCQFEGWNGQCWTIYDNKLYYGNASGEVYRCDTGSQDVSSPINADCITAFNAFGSRATEKQVTATNVVTNYAYPSYLAVDMLSDFSSERAATVTPSPYGGSSDWDTATWDVDAWATGEGEGAPIMKWWRNVRAFGYVLALSVRLSTRAQNVIWYSTYYTFKMGGPI